MITRVWRFFTWDLWRIKVRGLGFFNALWIKFLRVVFLSVRRFNTDDCYLKASALTFYSLLSIVPVLAALFGVAKGFGLHEHLETELLQQFSEQREVLEQAIAFAMTMLEQTRGGLIAGVGVGFLLWTVIKLLGNVEDSLNKIWAIHKTRSMGRKFSDYLAVIIVCPIFITAAGSANVFMVSQIKNISEQHEIVSTVSPVLFTILSWAPFALVWFVFTFLYLFIPNGKVSWCSGILGGLVAGIGYQLIQWAYIEFQIGVARYGAIYGSFAALPLFLIWLQTSWMIVLYGAEVAATSQNLEDYEFRFQTDRLSSASRRLVELLVAQHIIQGFCKELPAKNAWEISSELEAPIRLIRESLANLSHAGVVSEVMIAGSEEPSYQPATDVELITVQRVVQALDDHGTNELPVAQSPKLDSLMDVLEERRRLFNQSPPNVRLKDL